MKENSAPVEADRISDLPDEILCRILSFLPTEHAFKTTFLSKRWTPLCYSLTALCFDDETVQDEDDDDAFNGFCRFVDTLMLSPRVTNQPIKTFRLRCLLRPERFPFHSLEAWVEAAKRRHVEEFHLTMFDHTFTPTIFTSQTLVVLKLEDLVVTTDDFSVHLPSLKTLYLKFVYFKNPKNVIIKLLSACPILENLHLSHHIYTRREENNEEFKSLFLSKLVRADIGSINIPFTTLANVEFLNLIGVHEPSFQINIEDIFKGIPVFRNLIHIKLFFYGVFRGWVHVVELLQHCPKLQILYMRKWDTSSSMYWKPPISDLHCVSPHLISCTVLNFQGSENDIQFAKYILQNANILQDIKIGVTTSSSNGKLKHQIIEELSSCPRMSPGCKLSF